MFENLDPQKVGLRTRADTGFFLIGTFIGGALDAIFDVAGFAEPLVFAGICGAGSLGVKALLDALTESNKPRSK